MDITTYIPFQLDFDVAEILLSLIYIILLIVCLMIAKSKNLLESLILMSVFSLFISLCYLLLDAPDVAMTEVALGACLSTCVILNIIKITGEDTGRESKGRAVSAFILCSIFVGILSWASLDLPEFGNPENPIQTHVNKYYLENAQTDINIPSYVAAILASYRGFDTLGETAVILIAGLGVILIMNKRKKRKKKDA